MGKLGAKIWRKGEVDGKRYGLEGAKGVRYRGADRQRCDDDERPFLLRMLSQAVMQVRGRGCFLQDHYIHRMRQTAT
jgi:hypothetical protein